MRQILAPTLLALLALPAFLGAQQQERKLLERIQRPDRELTNPMQTKSFNSGGGVGIKDAAMGRHAFAGARSTPLKEFAGTRSFFGIKNPWFGNRVFETKPAEFSKSGGLGNLNAAYPVRDALTQEFPSSKKQAGVGTSSVPIRPFLVSGEAQGALEQISGNLSKEMTIDDIRELLNKPR